MSQAAGEEWELIGYPVEEVNRYALSADTAHLERAKVAWAALSKWLPSPLWPAPWMIEAATADLLAAYATDQTHDLRPAERLLRTAAADLLEGRTTATALNNLGCLSARRADRTGASGDLRQAQDAFGDAGSTALAAQAGDRLQLVARANLGTALYSAYLRDGSLEQLDEARSWFNRAFDVISPDEQTPDTPLVLPGHGPAPPLLLARAVPAPTTMSPRLQLDTIARTTVSTAMVYATAAAVTREQALHKTRHNSSAQSMDDDFESMRDLLETWRELLEQLRPLISGSAAELAVLTELGRIYRRRHDAAGDPQDLDLAIARFDAAAGTQFGWAAGRPVRTAELADLLLQRYDTYNSQGDLKRAALALRTALAKIPPGTPRRGAPMRWWARCRRLEYARSKWTKDLADAVAIYREAVDEGMASSAEDALLAAQDWADWAASRGSFREAAEAYGKALEALELLYRRQLLRLSKDSWLIRTRGLDGATAYALARSGDRSGAAVTIERGRARSTSDALARRNPDLLQRLDAEHPDLRDRYLSATTALGRLESGVHAEAT